MKALALLLLLAAHPSELAEPAAVPTSTERQRCSAEALYAALQAAADFMEEHPDSFVWSQDLIYRTAAQRLRREADRLDRLRDARALVLQTLRDCKP